LSYNYIYNKYKFMEQLPEKLESNESLPEYVERENINEINPGILRKVVDEMLVERDNKEIVKKGFIWRVIFLYNQETGIKMNQDEMRQFYEKIKSELIKIFDFKKIKYKFEGIPSSEKMTFEDENNKAPYMGWLPEWEEKQK